jgi:Xaa-Pro aminopeptidase
MLADLDRLMTERNLDAIIIEGPDGMGSANPAFNYFVRGQHLTGFVIKRRGAPATLIHSAWEEAQARATGLALRVSTDWPWREILKAHNGNMLAATIEYRRLIYTDLGVAGRVGVYGTAGVGQSYALLRGLERVMPEIEIVAEYEQDVVDAARLAKDPHEIVALREVGRRAVAVVQTVVDYIAGCSAEGTNVVRDGRPVTIGEIHALIERESAARGLENPQGFIFAQGREAGLPHAHGTASEPLRTGEAIVFDYYPRQAGGGYFHDITRTFAIGHAPAELQALYADVLGAFTHITAELEQGAPTKAYQDMVCAYFEERGHDTIGKTYPITEGYIHSLGHGIGLEVHEDLAFPALRDRGDILVPGAVFTIEPGLYYPSKGMGVRIEDSYYANPDGSFESLTPFPKELVIALKG